MSLHQVVGRVGRNNVSVKAGLTQATCLGKAAEHKHVLASQIICSCACKMQVTAGT